MDLWKCFRRTANSLDCFVDTENKLQTESLPLMFIPELRLEILLRPQGGEEQS